MTKGFQTAYSKIRMNKKVLFWLFGFLGGATGALLSEFIFVITPEKQNIILGILTTAIWAGIFSSAIATGLFYAIDVYGRRNTNWIVLLKKSVPAGFISGVISGSIAQAIFGPLSGILENPAVLFLFQSLCWGILGMILGWWLSKSVPNLGAQRAVIAGFAGGFIGGIGFLLISYGLELLPGHMLGIGVLGAALGFCIIMIEERSRSAYLEVHWAPGDTSYFTLGSIPVYIGAGDSDIGIPTVPNRAMSLVIEGGKIIATDHTKKKSKEMQDGNRISIGKIEMIIRTGIETMNRG